MTEPAIREATSSDLDELCGLRLSLQRHLERSNLRVWRITKRGRNALKRRMRQLGRDKNSLLFFASTGSRVVGFASGEVLLTREYVQNRVGVISTVYVHERYRRLGIGQSMVTGLCEFFRSRHVEDVTVGHIIGNKEGQAFWASLGFKPVRVSANVSLKQLEERVTISP